MKLLTAELLQHLDQPAITTALRSVVLPEHEYDTATQLVTAACDTFLANDLQDWCECRVEKKWRDGRSEGTWDLILLRSAEALIVDWKTTTGERFPPNYEAEHRDSWQTFMYLGQGQEELLSHGYRANEMHYRCLSAGGDVKTIVVEWRESFRENSLSQAAGIEAMYRGLKEVSTWPRSLPYPCHKGSREGPTCPFWHDCISDTAPLVVIDDATFEKGLPLRRSYLNQFLECPERYRREVVLGEGREGSYEMNMGSSVTSALAEIWKQAFDLKGKT